MSNTVHQIAQTHFQCCRDSHERIHGDIFLPALNVANVIVVEIGFLGQFLLAPFHCPAMRSDVFAQNLPVFRDFHDPNGTRNRIYGLPYMHCILFLRFFSISPIVGQHEYAN
jgi:hypothetical protein